MSLRISLRIAAVLFTALTAVSCSPPPIRCETDAQCTSDMKCDVRQGLCVDKGTYIENPDGGPVTGGSIDCQGSGCMPPGKDR
jgi:hypothetical protein